MAFSGSQITRLGVSGVPRGLYGSFAGKAAAAAEAINRVVGFLKNVGKLGSRF